MKTEQKLGNGTMLIHEWCFCLKCCTFIHKNTEKYVCVKKNGIEHFAHYHCPKFKQPLKIL